MQTKKFFNDARETLNKFGPEILTGLAIIFTGMAIKSAIDHAEEATKVNMEYTADVKELNDTYKEDPETKSGRYPWGSKDLNALVKQRKLQRNIELVLAYKWSFIFGFSSAVCMACSTKLSGSKIAAAYALAKLNEDKLKIALEKAKEFFGEDGANKLENKIMEELAINKNAPFVSTKNPGLNQPEIFVDGYTGAWVETTRKNILTSIQRAKDELSKNHALSYKRWLVIFGYPSVDNDFIDIGWNVFKPFDAEIVDEMVGDKVMHYIKYKNKPMQNFMHMTK